MAFKLDIYTPQGVVVESLECKELSIPTTSGEIDVLEGHTQLITRLDTGLLKAKVGDNRSRSFTMTTGLCKVLGEQVTILSNTTEKAEEIDVERARSAKSKAESRLQNVEALSSIERIKFQRKLDRANVRIKLAEFNK